jgi:hypothetical protein
MLLRNGCCQAKEGKQDKELATLWQNATGSA